MKTTFLSYNALIDLLQALPDDSLILTSNKRLTAKVSSYYHQIQPHATYKPPCILPFNSWLTQLFENLLLKGLGENKVLLSVYQTQIIWKSIIRAANQETLLQTTSTAIAAVAAWKLLQHWNIDLNDARLQTAADSIQFIRWAKQFSKKMSSDYLDPASLINYLYDNIAVLEVDLPQNIILIGFWDFPPAYQRFLERLKATQVKINYFQLKCISKSIQRIACANTEDEMLKMAVWAKQLITQQKDITIGCVVPLLSEQRKQLERIFAEVFEEASNLPFNISLGNFLGKYPIIYAAFEILQLVFLPSTMDEVSFLLRSDFIGCSLAEKSIHALLDVELRALGNTTYDLSALIDALSRSTLAKKTRLLSKLKALKSLSLLQAKTPGEWAKTFSNSLSIMHWPSEAPLNSETYQIIERFQKLLYEFSQLNFILPRMESVEALQHLERLANQTVFQPSVAAAKPIQILGMLEASGELFDAVWVMGLDHLHWPFAAKPNPLLPAALQRECHMPHASFEQELHFSRLMMENFIAMAPNVIFSHASLENDFLLEPSALITTFSEMHPNKDSFLKRNHLSAFEKTTVEQLSDERVMFVSEHEKIHGGTNILKRQSLCPFQAFAKHRLRAESFDVPQLGLNALERGSLLHQALEFIWQTIKTSDALVKVDAKALKKLIRQSIQEAIKCVLKKRRIEKAFIQLEKKRLLELIYDWLMLERTREPFEVIAQEKFQAISVHQLKIRIRLDRIDKLSNGHYALIDYKTGKVNLNAWFGDRLEEPQLPLYAISVNVPIDAIAFAEIRQDGVCFKGLSIQKNLLPGDKTLNEMTIPHVASDWKQQFASWQQALTQLASAFYEGEATVDPKNHEQTCQYCDLQSLCRIYEK